MKRRTRADAAVRLMVINEHAQGLRARERRQLRGSDILSMSCPGASQSCLLREMGCRLSAGEGGFDPLGGDCAMPIAFSTFLRSRDSECLVTSYLAEVKLFFFPCLLFPCLLRGRFLGFGRVAVVGILGGARQPSDH